MMIMSWNVKKYQDIKKEIVFLVEKAFSMEKVFSLEKAFFGEILQTWFLTSDLTSPVGMDK